MGALLDLAGDQGRADQDGGDGQDQGDTQFEGGDGEVVAHGEVVQERLAAGLGDIAVLLTHPCCTLWER